MLLSLLLFCLFFASFHCAPSPAFIAELKAAVRKKSYDASFKFSSASKYNPIFWSRRAQMSAVTTTIEATEYADHELIDLLDENAAFLIAHTSEAQNVKDRVLNKVIPAWVTGGYSCGIAYSQVVLSGVTQESIAQWVLAAILAKDYCESAECQAKLVARMAFLERSVAVYDNLYKSSGNKGWYQWPTNLARVMGSCDAQDWKAREGTPLPYNMMISMAQTRHVMWRIYGLSSVVADSAKRSKHERVVKAIGEYFKANLQFVSGTTSYKWLYSPNGRWEDVSHAVSDLRFVAAMVEHGPSGVFSAPHLERFGNTFNWITANPDKPYSHVVNDYGGPTDKASTRQSLGSWSLLTPWAGFVYNAASFITYSQEDGDSMRSRALIEKHKPDSGNYVYPRVVIRARGDVHNPWEAISPPRYALLARSSTLTLSEWAGKSVSTCIAAHFAVPVQRFQIRYGHTSILGPKDKTAGGAGINGLAFYSSSSAKSSGRPSSSSWRYVAGSVSAASEKTGAFVLSSYTLSTPVRWLAFCRGGSGHAANNLRVSYFRAIVEPKQETTTILSSSSPSMPSTLASNAQSTTSNQTPNQEPSHLSTTTTLATTELKSSSQSPSSSQSSFDSSFIPSSSPSDNVSDQIVSFGSQTCSLNALVVVVVTLLCTI